MIISMTYLDDYLDDFVHIFLFTNKIIHTYFARCRRFLYVNITHIYNLLMRSITEKHKHTRR